jgi:hypothetical protein
MGDVLELARARKRTPFKLPEMFTRVWDVFGGLVPPGPPESYSIWGRGDRTYVMLKCGRLSINVSSANKFANTAEARKWAATFLARHRLDIPERPKHDKPPMRQPRGDDRKAYRAGDVHEAWLESDVPVLWAAAMVRCQHPGGFCGADGYCHYGDCSMTMNPEPVEPENADAG